MVLRNGELRRKQILGATLAILRSNGPAGTTTAKIAARASCSKETIYNWFDDREGLFASLIHTQAEILAQLLANVVVENCVDTAELETEFVRFGAIVLDVFSGEAHILTNRAAIAAIGENQALAEKVNEQLYLNVQQKCQQLVEQGGKLGLLEIDDLNHACSDYFGLLMGDRRMALLLGKTSARPEGSRINELSSRCFANFSKIYGI